jgi:hypothetical protein
MPFRKHRLPGMVCREGLRSAGAYHGSWQPLWPVWRAIVGRGLAPELSQDSLGRVPQGRKDVGETMHHL